MELLKLFYVLKKPRANFEMCVSTNTFIVNGNCSKQFESGMHRGEQKRNVFTTETVTLQWLGYISHLRHPSWSK